MLKIIQIKDIFLLFNDFLANNSKFMLFFISSMHLYMFQVEWLWHYHFRLILDRKTLTIDQWYIVLLWKMPKIYAYKRMSTFGSLIHRSQTNNQFRYYSMEQVRFPIVRSVVTRLFFINALNPSHHLCRLVWAYILRLLKITTISCTLFCAILFIFLWKLHVRHAEVLLLNKQKP